MASVFFIGDTAEILETGFRGKVVRSDDRNRCDLRSSNGREVCGLRFSELRLITRPQPQPITLGTNEEAFVAHTDAAINSILDAGNKLTVHAPRSHTPSMGVEQAEAINADLENRANGGWPK